MIPLQLYAAPELPLAAEKLVLPEHHLLLPAELMVLPELLPVPVLPALPVPLLSAGSVGAVRCQSSPEVFLPVPVYAAVRDAAAFLCGCSGDEIPVIYSFSLPVLLWFALYLPVLLLWMLPVPLLLLLP